MSDLKCPECGFGVNPNARCIMCGWKPEGLPNQTGLYAKNPETGQLEKVADTAIIPGSIWWPDASDHCGYTSESLGVHFTSRAKKREYMKTHQIAERGY